MSGTEYTRANAPERVCMKLSDWPVADRRLWQHAINPVDLFSDEGGTRANHRAISNRNIEKSYGRYLTYLKVKDLLHEDDHPADRITSQLVADYIRELDRLGNEKGTMLERLEGLSEMAKVFDLRRDWSFIGEAASRVRARKEPASSKSGRLVEAHELFELGLSLMTKANTAGFSPRKSAVLFRDGLIIALLSCRPMRLKNLTELAIGRDLVQSEGIWTIVLTPSQTKTHVALEFPWPEELNAALETYLTTHRRTLLARTGRWHRNVGDRLWVSVDGSPLIDRAIYDKIVSRTRSAFGSSVNPHLFRDAAATSLAIHDPAHVRVAAPLLGHRKFDTTQRHYNQARSLTAQRTYAEHIAELRKTLLST